MTPSIITLSDKKGKVFAVIKKKAGMEVASNISLKDYNTFGIDAVARHLVKVSSVEKLQDVLKQDRWKETPKLILGGGSNVLFTSPEVELVVKMDIRGIEVIEENDDFVWIKVGAGENWHELVMYCIDQGWGGVENLSLIPGTVGAAPMQNIGAYGVEIKDVFTQLEAVDIETATLRTFNPEECKFGYRESVFKNIYKEKYIIASVNFRLNKRPQINTSYGAIEEVLTERLGSTGAKSASIRDVSEAVIHIRQSKLPDPNKIGNAGSFFKNPVVPRAKFEGLQQQFTSVPGYPVSESKVKVPAGWLIEQAGWKGKRFGNVGVHNRQALVLVNFGSAQGEEIKKLAYDIQQSVQEKFGILIQPEVNIV
ncbi:UDP-N-acetylmuramate dehydrogenase [Tunicatimonas pelagia]|uniref:UDP-N-acetylmuramate dehydrogenase n=1 Tax=Tunicatimonas pelagia TaxID=931531 RepID=UPI0026666197|nr:UDP-N-acetylmuramate dehydrogenase [Tunicatimonas pelagia]WKN41735.1 UDP-N-acetylmuramate dehydrogenase [Tunicatimonas pelagia]